MNRNIQSVLCTLLMAFLACTLAACQKKAPPASASASTATVAAKPMDAASTSASTPAASAAVEAPPEPPAGKRKAPAEVPPVKIGEITYEVVHWTKPLGKSQNGGFIAAKDAQGKQLWLEQIYSYRGNGKEGDAEDVFITSMNALKGSNVLDIADEKGASYRFDVEQRKLMPQP